jgi:hypothetical protein
MKKLREFREYTPEQVQEVARMLYALRPFDASTREKYRWNSLVRQAFDFLDNLHEACKIVAEQRRALHEHYAALNVQLAETDKLLEVVPFKKAARIVTGDRRTSRAKRKLITVLKRLPIHVPSKELSRWQKDGIQRDLLRDLKRVFKSEWPLVIAEQNKAKRAKRADKRRGAKPPG